MTPDQAYETVAGAFGTFWGVETPIAWDEVDFDAKGVTEYVRFSWQPQQGGQIELGADGTHRYEGLVFVQIFTGPYGSGEAGRRNRILQGRVLTFLREFNQSVTFRSAGAQYVGRDRAWLQFNVSAEFHYDSQRAA